MEKYQSTPEHVISNQAKDSISGGFIQAGEASGVPGHSRLNPIKMKQVTLLARQEGIRVLSDRGFEK